MTSRDRVTALLTTANNAGAAAYLGDVPSRHDVPVIAPQPQHPLMQLPITGTTGSVTVLPLRPASSSPIAPKHLIVPAAAAPPAAAPSSYRIPPFQAMTRATSLEHMGPYPSNHPHAR